MGGLLCVGVGVGCGWFVVGVWGVGGLVLEGWRGTSGCELDVDFWVG